jgi:hypothetical protein
MFHVVLPTIETLFAGNGRPRQPVRFDWRLIRRNKRPFLLLPTTMTNVRVGLELYSAQRRRCCSARRRPSCSTTSHLKPMPTQTSCAFLRSNPACPRTGSKPAPSS